MVLINIFRNFLEDNRRSMENYANQLQKILKDNLKLKLRIITPRMSITNSLRFSRYFSYPIIAKKISNEPLSKNIVQFNHIIEDGYAHLLKNLDNNKTVITVHDLIPLILWKKNLLKRKPPLLYLYSLSYLKKAKYIFADSLNTKRDIIKYCNCKPDKIFVVYLGYKKNFKKFSEKKRFFYRKKIFRKFLSRKLILIIGQEFYKNHNQAIKSIIFLKKKIKKKLSIVHIGTETPKIVKSKKFKSSQVDYIRFSNLNLTEIVKIYNCCDCLLFPSLYEGFGLPVIEAMACGLPVISSKKGSLKEIASAALHCDPYSVKNISKKLELVLTDNILKKKLIKNGLLNAKKYTENKFKNAIIRYYKFFLKNYEI